ncbi:hypothetical protein [Chitinophaga pinensis]|uniref:Uncharacterized protein n=1 Tax=Chitinophaga pinensis TaxID=79329 RepID=A0A5C6LR33_9BACT|nr:hypothetical protein [Chitinophaga pinensis]TWV99057.1 hypothetical protein FEF09_18560 [Chitinophaga pinensis]
MIRSNLYRLVAYLLLVTFSYIQGVQILHDYHHHYYSPDKHLHFGKDPACKICDHLLVKKHQSLTADIFTLRDINVKPEIIREVACTRPTAIFLPNDLNKDPPSIA